MGNYKTIQKNNKKEEEKEQIRLTKIVQQVFKILLEDQTLTVNDADIANMGIQTLLMEEINKYKRTTKVKSLKLIERIKKGEPRGEKFKKIFEALENESIASSEAILDEFRRQLIASSNRKSGNLKLGELDIIKLIK